MPWRATLTTKKDSIGRNAPPSSTIVAVRLMAGVSAREPAAGAGRRGPTVTATPAGEISVMFTTVCFPPRVLPEAC